MKYLLPALLAIIILLACSRDHPNDPFKEHAWLNEKKQELNPCTCLSQIRQSVYLGQTVFEIRLIDPICDGINIVYRENGSVIFNQGQQAEYLDYVQKATHLKILWTCAR